MPEYTGKRLTSKPAKPHIPTSRSFPMPRAGGRRRCRGRLHYFGPWEDADGALEEWLRQKDDLLAGRKPRLKTEGITLKDVINSFLTAPPRSWRAANWAPRAFPSYYDTCLRFANAVGKTRAVDDLRPDDFNNYRAAITKKWGPVSVANEVQRVRSLFKYGFEAGLMERPVLFGPLFKKPKRRDLRLARQKAAPRFFDADQIRLMLDSAKPQMKAMIFLAINCGWGNTDIAMVQRNVVAHRRHRRLPPSEDRHSAALPFGQRRYRDQRRVAVRPNRITG